MLSKPKWQIGQGFCTFQDRTFRERYCPSTFQHDMVKYINRWVWRDAWKVTSVFVESRGLRRNPERENWTTEAWEKGWTDQVWLWGCVWLDECVKQTRGFVSVIPSRNDYELCLFDQKHKICTVVEGIHDRHQPHTWGRSKDVTEVGSNSVLGQHDEGFLRLVVSFSLLFSAFWESFEITRDGRQRELGFHVVKLSSW